MMTTDMELKHTCSLAEGEGSITKLDSILKSRDITDKGPYSQNYGFTSSHVWI